MNETIAEVVADIIAAMQPRLDDARRQRVDDYAIVLERILNELSERAGLP